MSLKQLKTQLKSIQTLQRIIGAMELTSSIKLQTIVSQTVFFKFFFKEFIHCLNQIQPHVSLRDQELLVARWSKRKLLIVISTDKWLVWWLNSNLFKVIEKSYLWRSSFVELITIWQKWKDYFSKKWRNITASLQTKDKITAPHLVELYNYLWDAIHSKKYSKIKIYFNHCKNTLSQIPARLTIFPLTQDTLNNFTSTIDLPELKKIKNSDSLIIEPSIQDYTDNLLYYIVENLLYYCVLDAKISENSARLSNMKQAKDNAQKQMQKLKINYNKARQAKITNETTYLI